MKSSNYIPGQKSAHREECRHGAPPLENLATIESPRQKYSVNYDTSMTLDHVCLVVPSATQARDFYRRVLYLQEEPRPQDFAFHGHFLRNNDVRVHLVERADERCHLPTTGKWTSEEHRTGHVSHFAVKVKTFEPFLDALDEWGGSLSGGPRVRTDHVEQIYIKDPFGNVIELLYQHTRESAIQRLRELWATGRSVPVAPGYPVDNPTELT